MALSGVLLSPVPESPFLLWWDLEREGEQASPPERAADGESEEDNYMPLSEDEVSLGNKKFIVPEDPVKQERFKRRLIATAKSLKKM